MGYVAGGKAGVVVIVGELISRIENRTQPGPPRWLWAGDRRVGGPNPGLTGRFAGTRLEGNAGNAPSSNYPSNNAPSSNAHST
jgi:hypothetical protein